MNETKKRMRTISSPLIVPRHKGIVSKKHPLYSGIMLPKFTDKLDFRFARAEESLKLKELYEGSWNGLIQALPPPICSQLIQISREQIEAMITNFPEGQIVGVEKGKDEPVSMINIMLMVLRKGELFKGGYERVTGNRTFSTSMKPIDLLETLDNEENALGIASCVSIATHPDYLRFGYANLTLNYAIMFSLANHLIPAPYSAPRGFAKARLINPKLDISHYLHMTKPISRSYESYMSKIIAISPRICAAFRGESGLSKKMFEKYQRIKSDSPSMSIEETAFWKFMNHDGLEFYRQYGRIPTIEDFAITCGRILLDPVIRMHVQNGARFLRNERQMAGIFRDSRPEDVAAMGYNIVLSYVYHPFLGHNFVTD
jgi:hypothetical protein